MYKYEMHLHTNSVSLCGRSTPEEMVKAFYEKGFSGIVITDHFIHGNTAVDRNLPWNERMKLYFSPYEEAKKLAEKLGFSVFIGIEHAYGNGKELLVYGDLTAQAFIDKPNVETMDVHQFIDFCHKNGWFVAHAHPFRERPYINMDVPPVTENIDGIEVYNHFNKPEENIKAIELCEKLDLIPISGSDTHISECAGFAGVAFDYKINTAQELVNALLKGDGKLIVNGDLEE